MVSYPRPTISEKNDFALLAAIGGECAGAVMLLPQNTSIVQLTEFAKAR